MTRRMFEHLALLLFPLVYAGGLLSAAWKFLQPVERRPVQEKFPLEKDRAYFDDDDAEPVEINFNGAKVFVLKVGETMRAFDSQCTHLACNVEWKHGRRQFICPCHNGSFKETGEVDRKPPMDPLKEYLVTVDESTGAVVVQNKIINRT